MCLNRKGESFKLVVEVDGQDESIGPGAVFGRAIGGKDGVRGPNSMSDGVKVGMEGETSEQSGEKRDW